MDVIANVLLVLCLLLPLCVYCVLSVKNSECDQEIPQSQTADFSLRARKIHVIHYSCEGRKEKSVPQDHPSSSPSKPHDAKR